MSNVLLVQVRAAVLRFRWRDGLFGLGAAAVDLAAFWAPGKTSSGLATVALAVLGGISLGWRRAAPIWVFMICLGESVTAGLFLGGYRPTVIPLAALYTVCAYAQGRFIAVLALLAMFALSVFWAAREGKDAEPGNAVTVMLVTVMVYALVDVAVFAAGQWRKVQIRYVLESRRREQIEAAAAVAADRARIATDLHDTVAHHVTVIILQAAIARTTQLAEPEKVALTLERIEDAGREAMDNLRQMLILMRADDDRFTEMHLRPPGMGDLPELIATMSSAGLTIDFQERGARRSVDPATGLAAYRVVQEGLTNIAKHAGLSSPTRVGIEWGEVLVVEIQNGPASGSTPLQGLSTGLGLFNLASRAEAVGGRLSAVKSGSGGFIIRAELPAQLQPPEHTHALTRHAHG